jgi:L-fuconolactonase
MAEKIDAHHHLWRYQTADYGWIDHNMGVLKRDFLPADLERELRSTGIDGAVAVQARQTLGETSWLLDLASNSTFIRGVVGWAPIASENFPAELERLCTQERLKGLRHVIQDEPDDNFILGEKFNTGISRLKDTSLVYDILIFEKHLPATIEFVDRHPHQVFVLDHVAKPKIRDRVMDPWRAHIAELARRENVYCKISGMVTEANWLSWSKEDLWPYLEVVLESFRPERLMAGSDWPVCLLAASYGNWFKTLNELLGKLSATERDQVFGMTAGKVYRLRNEPDYGEPLA